MHVSLYAGGEIGIGTSWWTEKGGRRRGGKGGRGEVCIHGLHFVRLVCWLVGGLAFACIVCARSDATATRSFTPSDKLGD